MQTRIYLGLVLATLMTSQAMGQLTIRSGGGGFSRSISVSNENGLKTTRVTENGKKYVIREGEELIEVEFANTYGPNDMEKLKEKHPDLHMHVTSFPKKSGDLSVELTISVKEKVSAENESELKEKSEAAFKLFEKYTKNGTRLIPRVKGIDLSGRIDLGDLDIVKPAKIIELEKDVQKRLEEARQKALEMRKKFEKRGPLFSKPDAKKDAEEKSDKKNDEPSKKKKDLIDI